MTGKKKLVTCAIALFAILAALLTTLLVHPPAAQAASAYGAGAYTGSNPIGGGNGYVSRHGFSQAGAKYVVRDASQLRTALASATSGQVIWIPDGVVITVSVSNAAGMGTLKPGAVLASNRGQNGAAGGKIKNTANGVSYMNPIVMASSNSIISGLRFEGPGGMCGTSGPNNAAIRGVNGARRIEVENCEIGYFYTGGIYFYGGGMTWNDDGSNGRHWVHHCYIHHIQRWGYGYGVSQEGACSFLVEACHFGPCRHQIMAQANSTGMEVRYCEFEDAVFAASESSHQVDSHGGNASTSTTACRHISVHHNTFSANNMNWGKPNVCIRGTVPYGAEIYNNWTKKLHSGQSGAFSETYANPAFTVWGGASGTLASYGVKVYNNWYGSTAPSGSSASSGGTSYAGTSSGSTSSGSTSSGSTSSGSTSSGSTSTTTSTSGTTISTKPAAPKLISPAAGATVSGSSVTFRWNASAGATKYFLIVSTSSSLTTTQTNSSVRKVWTSLGNVTSYTATGFVQNGKTYYWWVFSGNSYGWSAQYQVVANGGWRFVDLS